MNFRKLKKLEFGLKSGSSMKRLMRVRVRIKRELTLWHEDCFISVKV